jgi:hypothetical protein
LAVEPRGLSKASRLAHSPRYHVGPTPLLAEASERRNPKALSAALELLVANRASRAVLDTPDGCRLVDEGSTGVDEGSTRGRRGVDEGSTRGRRGVDEGVPAVPID